MGDRCYVGVNVWHEDSERFIKILGEPNEHDATHDGFIHIGYEEYNYAASDEMFEAAKEGLRFYGYHSGGGDYDASNFAAPGDGEVHYAMVARDTGRITAEVEWTLGQTEFAFDPESMKTVGEYIEARSTLEELAKTTKLKNIMMNIAFTIETVKDFDKLSQREVLDAIKRRVEQLEACWEPEAIGFCDEFYTNGNTPET